MRHRHDSSIPLLCRLAKPDEAAWGWVVRWTDPREAPADHETAAHDREVVDVAIQAAAGVPIGQKYVARLRDLPWHDVSIRGHRAQSLRSSPDGALDRHRAEDEPVTGLPERRHLVGYFRREG